MCRAAGAIAPCLEVQTCYADAEDTEDLLGALEDEDLGGHLAEGSTEEVDVAVAILLADLANDEPLRVVVGAANSDDRVNYLGLRWLSPISGEVALGLLSDLYARREFLGKFQPPRAGSSKLT